MELLFYPKMLTNEPNYFPLVKGDFVIVLCITEWATQLPTPPHDYGNECTTLE